MFSGTLMEAEQVSRQVLTVLLNTSLKGLLILLGVYLFQAFGKKAQARTLHLAWFLAISCFLILPLLSSFIQPIEIGFFRLPETSGRTYQALTSAGSIDQPAEGTVQISRAVRSHEAAVMESVSARLRWTPYFLLWLAGALAVLSRSMYGHVKARKIVKESGAVNSRDLAALLDELCRRSGLSGAVRLCSSTQTGSPFTIGIFNPVLIIPKAMAEWSLSDIEPVLVHEIHHIKRKDYLTQTIAMITCLVFWFLPPMWAASKKLYVEQENACDAEVIRFGINPRHYARQMLNLAGEIMSPAAVPGLFMIKGRRRLFEKRIKNIMETGGRIAGKRMFFESAVLAVLIGAFLVFGACTSFLDITGDIFWPTKGWRSSRPEKQGMDSAKLGGITNYVRTESPNTTGVLVIRNGYIVFEEYYMDGPDTLRSLKGATMGVTSTLAGIAVTEGIIDSVDDRIATYLPDSYEENVSPGAAEIRFRHLLTMTSGLPALFWDDLFSSGRLETILSEPLEYVPGEYLQGDTVHYDLLSAIITDWTGKKTADFAEKKLFEPLGIDDYFWMGSDEYTYGAERLQLKARDIAKLGYLYLKRGMWENKQLVSPAYIEDAVKKQYEIPLTGVFGSDTIGGDGLYIGYGWYTRLVSGYSLHSAYGYFACVIEVIPELDMVVVITQDGTPPPHYPIVEEYILKAVL